MPFVCEAVCKPNKPRDKNTSPKNIGSNNSAPKWFIHESSKQYSYPRPIKFFHLLKGQFIQLIEGHVIPSKAEIRKCRYYNWHNSWCHATNRVIFCNVMQENFQKGMLKFPKEQTPMGIDSNMFLNAEVNMVSASPDKGKKMAEPSEPNLEEPTPMATDPLKPQFKNDADLATKLSSLHKRVKGTGRASKTLMIQPSFQLRRRGERWH